MIDAKIYYVFAGVSFAFFISCYWYIRGIIWSIVECNISKKTIRSAEFKKRKNSKSYLSKYIRVFYREYVFWMNIKSIYVVVESIWFLIYILLPVFIDILQAPFYVNLLQTIITSGIIIFQRDINRNTKFDRYRLDKKAKRK